ncbi:MULTISPECIES: LacI family DNA-binding transcriptional regulator [unclassified Microbacterium]|uniref:LacI family DNA-binding transcriptional regulator n=1 Tax=unclassified Microbacterium TaxID=2609290 RepID=UPI000EA98FE5|nr:MULTISPECIES: LacI family DNA-binding transcriptional regulator [unclassified Microbacterium]MBT2484405.1 LacI family DNA-binding transcriptional regulator [Microbacterium sp. ISL-108]RKN69503.1 LacI family transcriptional regulator [Microbacterium sp. CGR2]
MADVGIRDVASRAGLSVATVSNVLNRPELVSASAALRVHQAIDELGYVPNVAARQLRAGRSDAIGMAVINITNPFFSGAVLGAEEVAEQSGYAVIVGNSYDSHERESRYLDLFDRQRLDGILLAPVSDDLSGLDRFEKRDVPIVLVDRADPSGVHLSVSLDDVRGGAMAAEHLLAAGARHVAFVGGPFRVAQMRERFEGAQRAVTQAGARFSVIETTTLNVRLGRDIGDRIAAMDPADRPDGVFGGNDEVALGILQSLIHHGVSVPADIAIIGYDDIDFAGSAIVPLTSISQPSVEMGRRAAGLLLAALAGPAESLESVRFQPSLVQRQSTRTH